MYVGALEVLAFHRDHYNFDKLGTNTPQFLVMMILNHFLGTCNKHNLFIDNLRRLGDSLSNWAVAFQVSRLLRPLRYFS